MWLPRNPIQAAHSNLSPRGRRSSSAVGILVAAGLALTACRAVGPGLRSAGTGVQSPGSGVKSATSRGLLDTAKVEDAIVDSALTERGRHVRVTCPTGVQQKMGVVFYCTAYYGHSSTPFAVTELDSTGDVHYAAR